MVFDTEEAALRQDGTTFLPRDFVETAEGLLLAVVAHGVESGRALCFLRYARRAGTLCKLSTQEANELLDRRYREYLFHSDLRDVPLHGVPLARITRHLRPSQRLSEIGAEGPCDAWEAKVIEAAHLIGGTRPGVAGLGVTGSVLVKARHEHSDIDLVVYGKASFLLVRQKVRQALDEGQLEPLDEAMWREAYQRRGCSLTFDEYLWHEKRKLNKVAYDGTKVDVSCVSRAPRSGGAHGRKLDRRMIRATVTDDLDAFDYPARYGIAHAHIGDIFCYNPTFTGQARAGERVEASGWTEQMRDGSLRLVVGTSREAAGEYVKVLA